MKIKNACFVISNSDVKLCPKPDKPEYAFIGRSNVGKSSLINMLTDQKKLAKTSSRPGKTQLINHFLIDNSWYLVDLPGYGYAKVSKKDKEQFQSYIVDYVLKRENLYCLFVLIDSRHEPQKIDLEFMGWLGEKEVPFAIIFTKADKMGKNKLAENLTNYKNELLNSWDELPPIMVSSAEQRMGKDDILSFIDSFM